MNSASGTLSPLFSGCPRLSLFPSSLSSHQGHPRPTHRGPCARLSHPLAHISPQSHVPVPSVRCIPDVLCASHHLFSTSSSFPCQELWVASIPPGTMIITSLSLHYRARPLLAPSSASPYLPLFLSFCDKVQIRRYLHCPCFYSQLIRICTRSACLLPPTALLLPTSAPQSLREYFRFLILLRFCLVFLPGKAITQGTNILY